MEYNIQPIELDKVEEKVSPKVVTRIEPKQLVSASSSLFVEQFQFKLVIIVVMWLFICHLLIY